MNTQSNTSVDVNAPPTAQKSFIDGNSIPCALEELQSTHIVPVYSKDLQPAISHFSFIEAVQEGIRAFYPNEQVKDPDVRVSHPIQGRIPSALFKPLQYLEAHEKTIYFDRCAFVIEIPTITDTIDSNRLSLMIGGVKSYHEDNLHSRKGPDERFKIFMGFQNTVCLNLCVWSDGLVENIRVSSIGELKAGISNLIESYNAGYHLSAMKKLTDYSLTEQQFATFIGRCRMYQHLGIKQKAEIPPLLLGDTQIGLVCKDYYRDSSFCKDEIGNLNLWRLYNLLTGAAKTSYIDTFISRNVNAFQIVEGLKSALDNRSENWFLN